jgi:hypothetical protein
MEIHREPIGRGQGNELLNKLEAAGLESSLAQRVIDSKGNDLAAKVVRLISNGGFEATTSQKRAREIMGRNMFGVEEAIRHFGVTPSRQQIAGLSEIPFSETTLEQCKETHVLVAVFLSLLKIQSEPDFESSSENRHRIDVLRWDGLRSERRAAHPDRDRITLRYIDPQTTAHGRPRNDW